MRHFNGSVMFDDRVDAGRQLAGRLASHATDHPIVLGLARGGVPVAAEVARALGAALDVLVVRKIGAPFQPELGVGAVAEKGVRYVDWSMCHGLGITDTEVEDVAATERREVERRIRLYREGRPLTELRDRVVIIVDDGVATGGTARAAIAAVRAEGARRVVLAAPVAAAQTMDELAALADEVVTVQSPQNLMAIGAWYRDFPQVDDATVRALLRGRVSRRGAVDDASAPVFIAADDVTLAGDLAIPHGATGIVLFAHGSGSSRRSPRNRFVADALGRAGLATLLFDLLTEEEERIDAITARCRFDVDLLARRLTLATEWIAAQPSTAALRIGYFGASTGAAAALVAAAARPTLVGAVVSRGGRPDLAERALARVFAPTLLIVGSEDYGVIELNERALAALPGEKRLAIIDGATHLFEEPGALAQVATLAAEWFSRCLALQASPVHP